jgi:hypothetical protein
MCTGCDKRECNHGGVLLTLAVLSSAVVLSCDFYTGEITNLYCFSHHEHPLTFYVKTINHAMDTTGIRSAHLRPHTWRFWGANGLNGRYDVELPITIEVVQPDTEFHAYPTTITHFSGYQRRHGGDTMRFAFLNGQNDGWDLDLWCDFDTAWTEAGDTIRLMDSYFKGLPDTVRAGQPTEIEIVFDMDGLFNVDTSGLSVRIRSDRVQVLQR